MVSLDRLAVDLHRYTELDDFRVKVDLASPLIKFTAQIEVREEDRSKLHDFLKAFSIPVDVEYSAGDNHIVEVPVAV